MTAELTIGTIKICGIDDSSINDKDNKNLCNWNAPRMTTRQKDRYVTLTHPRNRIQPATVTAGTTPGWKRPVLAPSLTVCVNRDCAQDVLSSSVISGMPALPDQPASVFEERLISGMPVLPGQPASAFENIHWHTALSKTSQDSFWSVKAGGRQSLTTSSPRAHLHMVGMSRCTVLT